MPDSICNTCGRARSRCGHTTTKQQTTTAKGLGWQHAKLKALILPPGSVCHRCGAGGTPGNPLTMGHITPRWQGGQSVPGNLRPECRTCNSIDGQGSQRREPID